MKDFLDIDSDFCYKLTRDKRSLSYGAQAPVKSSESYRKWKQSEAALRRSLNPYY